MSTAIWKLAILVFSIVIITCAEKSTIDKDSRAITSFRSNNCHFAENYEDYYWAWGCPTQIHDYSVTTETIGFWTNCKKQQCQMVYFANGTSLKPSSIIVSVFIQGDGELQITGKQTMLLPIIDYSLSSNVAGKDVLCFGDVVVDLESFESPHDIRVLKVIPRSGQNGYVLIDSVIVCFKENDEVTCYNPTNGRTVESVIPKAYQCTGESTGTGGNASRLFIQNYNSLMLITIATMTFSILTLPKRV